MAQLPLSKFLNSNKLLMSECTVNFKKSENNVQTKTECSYLRIFFQKRNMQSLCISASTLDVDTLSFMSVPPLRQRTCKKIISQLFLLRE